MSNGLFSIVILAGGMATRLYPVTKTIPKSMILINDEPFIHHQLTLLAEKGFQHIVLCVGNLGEMIEEYVGNGARYNLKVEYSYDGSVLLGTGGAVKKALHLLGPAFFITYGDAFLTCDYAAVQQSFEQQSRAALMTIYQNNNQFDQSNVEYRNNEIMIYDKKNHSSSMQYIDYGLGIFTRQCFSEIADSACYDLALLYQVLLKKKQLAGYEVNHRFYEVGSFTGIKELEYYLMTA